MSLVIMVVTRSALPGAETGDSHFHLAEHGSAFLLTAKGGVMEKTFINPPELYKHPSYTRVITVKGPCKFIYLSGETPSDENYEPVGKGDYKKQYEHIVDALTIQLKAAGPLGATSSRAARTRSTSTSCSPPCATRAVRKIRKIRRSARCSASIASHTPIF